MNIPTSRWLTLAGVATLVAGTLTFAAADRAADVEKKDRAVPAVRLDKSPPSRDRGPLQSFSPVVKKAAPSVVYVFSTKTVRARNQDQFLDDPILRRFFGDQMPRRRQMPDRQESSLGSGVIVSSDGYILTNNHVVQGADEVRVSLESGKAEYIAEVIGHDPQTDLAVLKIDAPNLKPITLGDSDALEVGDVVLAIGNPFGIGQTVTSGIVSATGRGDLEILGRGNYEDFIQTDAAINPGNSGGALVDAEGRLIGINTAILSRSGGFMGVGFAVPINLAHSVMDQLVTRGTISRGLIGVNIQDLTPQLAKEFGVDEGALVTAVSPDSAADKAGLKRGDVITRVDGKGVADVRRLRLAVGRLTPGTEIDLQYVRAKKTQNVKLTLGAQASTELGGGSRERRDADKDEGVLNGVGVTDITPASRRELNIPADLKGALVSEVEEDSAAARAGVREGDLILEIDQVAVNDAKHAVELTEKANDKVTTLLIWREGANQYLVVDESKPPRKNR